MKFFLKFFFPPSYEMYTFNHIIKNEVILIHLKKYHHVIEGNLVKLLWWRSRIMIFIPTMWIWSKIFSSFLSLYANSR